MANEIKPQEKYTEKQRKTVLLSPDYRSKIQSNTISIEFGNPVGDYANVFSQKYTDNNGNSIVDLAHPNGFKFPVASNLKLTKKTEGLKTTGLTFDAKDFPRGPIAIRIDIYDTDDYLVDSAYFQFFNLAPDAKNNHSGLANSMENPVTADMKVVFADDFKKMPRIDWRANRMGNTGTIYHEDIGYAKVAGKVVEGIDYTGHEAKGWRPIDGSGSNHYSTIKADGGMFGWAYFGEYTGDYKADDPNNWDNVYDPYRLVSDGSNNYMNLITRYFPEDSNRQTPGSGVPGAEKWWQQKAVTGYLSSMAPDGTGFRTKPGHKAYFEVRMFTGPNPGLWPAFWMLTGNNGADTTGHPYPSANNPAYQTEHDPMEAYLGTPDLDQVGFINWGTHPVPCPEGDGKGTGKMVDVGGKEWNDINVAMGFHTIGMLITEKTTHMYWDNIETAVYNTTAAAWELGSYFMVNGQLSDHYGTPADNHVDAQGKLWEDTFGAEFHPRGFTRYGNENFSYVDWIRIYQDV